jgi:putative flippase GtrA
VDRARVFARFVVVNVVNTGVYYLLYLLLLLAMPYVVANVVALALAIVLAYFMNARWAFRVRLTGRTLTMFLVSNLTTTVLRTLVLWLLVEFGVLDERWAPIAATALTLPVAFLLTSFAMADPGAPATPDRDTRPVSRSGCPEPSVLKAPPCCATPERAG